MDTAILSGTRVYVGTKLWFILFRERRVVTIERFTATQAVCSDGMRFRLSDGRSIGHSSRVFGRILAGSNFGGK